MTAPKFFIVGAPKSGTSSLAHYLDGHPDVMMSSPKEPHYFATDLPGYRAVTSVDQYLALFSQASSGILTGEASVFYLYSKTAIPNIMEFDPDAKFIVMLRNPLDMVQSFHSQLLYTGDENVTKFEGAWDLIEERKAGKRIPKKCRDPSLLFYDEIAKYGEQFTRLTEIVDLSNIHVIWFDDFVRDTGREFRDVLRFLGVGEWTMESFERINPNRRHRSRFTRWVLFDSSRHYQGITSAVKRVLGIERIGLLDRLRRRSLIYEQRKAMPETLRRQVIAAYKSDSQVLEKNLELDLSSWFSGRGEIQA